MSDVLTTWLADGPTGFGPLTQAILNSQNPNLAAQVAAFSPNDAFVRAVVNAIAAIESAG